jgi:hypothetical protein
MGAVCSTTEKDIGKPMRNASPEGLTEAIRQSKFGYTTSSEPDVDRIFAATDPTDDAAQAVGAQHKHTRQQDDIAAVAEHAELDVAGQTEVAAAEQPEFDTTDQPQLDAAAAEQAKLAAAMRSEAVEAEKSEMISTIAQHLHSVSISEVRNILRVVNATQKTPEFFKNCSLLSHYPNSHFHDALYEALRSQFEQHWHTALSNAATDVRTCLRRGASNIMKASRQSVPQTGEKQAELQAWKDASRAEQAELASGETAFPAEVQADDSRCSNRNREGVTHTRAHRINE